MAKSLQAAYRPTGWPVLRTPRWMLAAAAVLAAGLVLVAIPHRPSTAQRAADLRGVVHDLAGDIESCAGGVTDSLTALRAIESGTSHDAKTAVTIANTAAANCSPGNNMQMEDLVQYQVPESLASFHLDTAVNDLVTWAFPLAQRVQGDAASRVAARTPAEIASTSAQLRRDQHALDAQRDLIDQFFTSASTALSAHVAPPSLPSLNDIFFIFPAPFVIWAKGCPTDIVRLPTAADSPQHAERNRRRVWHELGDKPGRPFPGGGSCG
jgi:hypothetical protein